MELTIHNYIPTPITPLVGREADLKAVQALLERDTVRLVTLSGPGGVGKTRLALAISQTLLGSFDALYFVALAALSDPALVASTLAQALDIQESVEQSLEDRLSENLAGRRVLLVLDNFEQVMAATSLVSRLLADCPGLKILVTSRAVLRLSGEHEYPVAPLDASEATSPALRLFAERAQAARPQFRLTATTEPLVRQICQRLDGLPLALELAAVRTRLLPLPALLERLDSGLKLLDGGLRDLPARQQGLRASLDWSYELLDPAQQQLLGRLSVFVGGWTLDAALSVAATDEATGLEALSELVNQSLVTLNEQAGEARYSLLEVIRQYAAERLDESGETALLRDRHLAWALQLTEQAAEELWQGRDQPFWLARLEAEHDNMRAALRWALPAQPEAGARLASGLTIFWDTHGYLVEGQGWLDQALTFLPQLPKPLQARLLFAAAWLIHRQNDFEAATRYCLESLALYRELADSGGILNGLLKLGWIKFTEGETVAARELLEESLSLARATHNLYCEAGALSYLGLVTVSEWDYERAAPLCEESVALCRRLGSNQFLGWAVTSLGAVSLFQGEFEQAATYFEESNTQLEVVGEQMVFTYNLLGLAVVALMQEQPTRAARLFGFAEALREKIGSPLLPVFKQAYELAVIFAATQLDETLLTQAWQEGRRLSLAEITFRAEATLPRPEPALALPAQHLPPTPPIENDPGLTARELDILRLLAEGLTNAEIAQRLILSPLTVGSYLRTVYGKLGVNSRSAATRYALEHRLV